MGKRYEQTLRQNRSTDGKHVKRCSSLVIRQMQIKTPVRYLYTPTGMTNTKATTKFNLVIPNTDELVQQLEFICIIEEKAK